jgi:hypothetical protein
MNDALTIGEIANLLQWSNILARPLLEAGISETQGKERP